MAHRDIKPENLLLVSNGGPVQRSNIAAHRVVLADFGLSNVMSAGQSFLKTPCGTPDYVAPEVLENKGYGIECDVWSAGVVAFLILSGHPPFKCANRAGLYRKIMGGEYSFHRAEWDAVSVEAKEFVALCMQVSPKVRMTAEGALSHEWLGGSDNLIDVRRTPLKSISNLREYARKLHAEAVFQRNPDAPVRALLKASSDASSTSRVAATSISSSGSEVRGPVVVPPADLPVGRAEDHYRIDRIIGTGSFGTVYAAVGGRKHDEYVAIKRFDRSDVDEMSIRRELAIMRLITHPHIVACLGSYRSDAYIDLVLEICQGGNLLDRLTTESQLSEARARGIVQQLASALSYLHGKGVAHRDLKPENVLFASESDDTVKLADFGLANMTNEDVSKMATACGTPDFVAPEVLRGESYNHGVDVWALGVLAYLMLVGSAPFEGDSPAELFDRILSTLYEFPEWMVATTSDESREFIANCLVDDPVHRMSAVQCRESRWLNEEVASAHLTPARRLSDVAGRFDTIVDSHVTNRLRAYARKRMARSRASSRASTTLPQPTTPADKRRQAYQVIVAARLREPVVLPDGYTLAYPPSYAKQLLSFIQMDKEYAAVARDPATDFRFNLDFVGEHLLFSVRGGDAKTYLAQLLGK